MQLYLLLVFLLLLRGDARTELTKYTYYMQLRPKYSNDVPGESPCATVPGFRFGKPEPA